MYFHPVCWINQWTSPFCVGEIPMFFSFFCWGSERSQETTGILVQRRFTDVRQLRTLLARPWHVFSMISFSSTSAIIVYPSIYLSIYLSICLSVCLSIYLFICLSIYLSVYLSIYLSIYLFICVYVYLSIYLSIHPSIYPSIYLCFIYIYIYSAPKTAM